jgi:O-antigen/teichoic acid export membrane protein
MILHKDVPITQRLGTQTLYVMSGNIFTLVVGLPLQIYVARVLGAEDLGIYSLVEGAIISVAGLVGFGISPTAVRFIPPLLEQGKFGLVRFLIFTGVFILLASGLIAYTIGSVSLIWLDDYWPQLRNHHDLIRLMGLAIPLSLLVTFLVQCLRGFQEVRYLVMGNSVLQLLVKVAVVICVFSVGLGIDGYALATVVATTSAVIWMSVGVLRKLSALPGKTENAPRRTFGEWSHYALVSYLTSLIGVIGLSVDRFLLGTFVGAAAVGVLVIVRQLQQLPMVFNQMLLMVGSPMFSAAYGRDDKQELQHLYSLTTDWTLRAAAPLILFLAIFTHPILEIYGSRFFHEGLWPLRILLASVLVTLITGPKGSIALMCGQEKGYLRLSMISAITFILLQITLIPIFELNGAAAAYAISAMFLDMACLYLVRKQLALKWWDIRFRAWLVPVGFTGTILFILYFWGIGSEIKELVAVLILAYGIFIALTLVQGLHSDDRELLYYIKKRVFSRVRI